MEDIMQTAQIKEIAQTKDRAEINAILGPKSGCYLIRYTRVHPYLEPEILHYDGTMRITRENARGELDDTGAILKASADLYSHPAILKEEWAKQKERGKQKNQPNQHDEPRFPEVEPIMQDAIPVFPRSLYRFYLQGLEVVEKPEQQGFLLRFRVHEFDQTEKKFQSKGNCVVLMQRPQNAFRWGEAADEVAREDPRPDARPPLKDGPYYYGDVINEESGEVVGRLEMDWIFEHLREGHVEMDCVEDLELPMDNKLRGADHCDWKKAFEGTGWIIHRVPSNRHIVQRKLNGHTSFWSIDDIHNTMVHYRLENTNLDHKWQYYLLCVPRIVGYERGVMYDGYGADADSEDQPHEGAAIASAWRFTKKGYEDEDGNLEEVGWGKAAGPIAASPAYFRCAVHEIGHAMGLEHNHDDNGFMNTTDDIRVNQVKGNLFPDNIKWRFHPKDQERLRHGPDVKVRPGTVLYENEPIFGDKEKRRAEGLKLHLTPLLETVPHGAPVRIHLKLENMTDEMRMAPGNRRSKSGLSIGSGHMMGKVTDSSGTVRTFSPVVMPMDADALVQIGPGTTDSHAITLLHGPQGPLFPSAGLYQVSIQLSWDEGRTMATLSGETGVTVSPARSDDHRKAARRILSTPETLLSLAIGGNHMREGKAAIDAALDSNVLRPHFEIVEAKRLAYQLYRPHPVDEKDGDDSKQHVSELAKKQHANIAAACKVLDDRTVLSVAEIKRVLQFLGWPPREKRREGPKAKAAQRMKAAQKIKDISGATNAVGVLKRKIDDMVTRGKIVSKEQIVGDLYELYGELNPKSSPDGQGGPPGRGPLKKGALTEKHDYQAGKVLIAH